MNRDPGWATTVVEALVDVIAKDPDLPVDRIARGLRALGFAAGLTDEHVQGLLTGAARAQVDRDRLNADPTAVWSLAPESMCDAAYRYAGGHGERQLADTYANQFDDEHRAAIAQLAAQTVLAAAS